MHLSFKAFLVRKTLLLIFCLLGEFQGSISWPKVQNFSPNKTKISYFRPRFFTSTLVKIIMAPSKFLIFCTGSRVKCCKSIENFQRFRWSWVRKWKLTNKKESREEIHKEQGQYQWITGTLPVYQWFSKTESLPPFSSWIHFLPRGEGAFDRNTYP